MQKNNKWFLYQWMAEKEEEEPEILCEFLIFWLLQAPQSNIMADDLISRIWKNVTKNTIFPLPSEISLPWICIRS